MSRNEFWNYKLNVIASRYYSNYKYPSKTYDKLKEIKEYCNKKGIELYFVVLPTHVSLQKKIKEFGLEKENNLFLRDLRKLGAVYNFDVPSEITKNKDNFVDPYHFCINDKLSYKIINDLFVFKKPLYSLYMKKTNIE
jgi:alpha-glucosidase (family GH31 glycosyl hydrolase)